MTITQQELEGAVALNFEGVADDVLTDEFVNSLGAATGPADFLVPPSALGAAGQLSVTGLPSQLRSKMLSSGAGVQDPAGAASPAAIVNSAGQSVRDAAAAAVQKMVCSQLREWFEQNLEQIKTWYEESGLKETVKKLVSVGKSLTAAAVSAITGVVGSVYLAYLLIGVAVAAVAVGIYFLIKSGVPNYCATEA